MIRQLLIISLLILSFATKGQENIYGEYCSWHLVHGHCLEIRPHFRFVLTESGNLYPQPTWTGEWTTKSDTLFLVFDSDSLRIKTHILESEYFIRTNLKLSAINQDSFQLEPPRYLYMTKGFYEDGGLKCELEWQSISTFNFTPTPMGQWKFYHPNGNIQRIEEYKKGRLSGDVVFYDNYGMCLSIERWKNGKLKRKKNCSK